MKLFRLRFILLGLLLCVCQVWSLSCRTEFDDPASMAYQSQVVLIGKVEQILPPVNSLYNVTVKIRKKREIFKGENFLKKGKRTRVGRITVGQFGPEDIDNCIASVKRDAQYFFFLNSTSDVEYLTNSRMPLTKADKKVFKKATKDIKKILKCSSGNCVKSPMVDTKKALSDNSVRFGRTIDLNCKIKRTTFPPALFQWYKDGIEINHKTIKGLSIKTGKKGSRLKKKKASLSDAGTYVCIVKNVGGEIKQQSVISISGVQRPEAPVRPMQDRKQKFGGTLKLTCKVKGDTTPKPAFSWFKDGIEIKDGSKPFLTIRTKGSESTLRKERAGLSDGGKYECIAENSEGREVQKALVTITDAPQKIVPCDKKDKNYCLNNGTCNIMVELNQKFCTCPPNYQGSRCDTFVIGPDVKRIHDGEQKLAQDRTIVVVGIISGILLFIGICVASYFLAKRRRDRFRRRRNQNPSHIEDIPQVYRPLKACDDVDGPGKHLGRGVSIHKETQTIETCFLTGVQEDKKLNLYINPLEGYIPPSREERNSRSRLAAVSSNGVQRTGAPSDLERGNSPSLANQNNVTNNSPNRPNSKRVPSELENLQSSGARDRTNDRNSVNPPAFNLSDSEDEILNEETPLTPLHISEDDDTLRRRRERQSSASTDNNASKFSYPRDSSNDSNYSKPPSYNTALKDDNTDRLNKSNSDEIMYASSSSSSSTTEGCDSPNSRYLNELSLSEPEINIPPYWNERGSPELPQESYNSVPKYDYPPPYANSDKRAATKSDRLSNFRRGEIGV